jgi:nucleotide-binding universal stress UspA family protein
MIDVRKDQVPMRLVVAVDGSNHAYAAAAWAARLAIATDGEVTAVFAIAPPMHFMLRRLKIPSSIVKAGTSQAQAHESNP